MSNHEKQIKTFNEVRDIIKSGDKTHLITKISYDYDENGFLTSTPVTGDPTKAKTSTLKQDYDGFLNKKINYHYDGDMNKLLEISKQFKNNSPYEPGLMGFIQKQCKLIFDLYYDDSPNRNYSPSPIFNDLQCGDIICIYRETIDPDLKIQDNTPHAIVTDKYKSYITFNLDKRLLHFRRKDTEFWMSLNEKFNVDFVEGNGSIGFKLKNEYYFDNTTLFSSSKKFYMATILDSADAKLFTHNCKYNNNGHIEESTLYRAEDGSYWSNIIYKYDEFGSLILEQEVTNGASQKIKYTRDDQNRIIKREATRDSDSCSRILDTIDIEDLECEYTSLDGHQIKRQYSFPNRNFFWDASETITDSDHKLLTTIDLFDKYFEIRCEVTLHKYDNSGMLISKEFMVYELPQNNRKEEV